MLIIFVQELECSYIGYDDLERIWVNARSIPDHMPHHYDRNLKTLIMQLEQEDDVHGGTQDHSAGYSKLRSPLSSQGDTDVES